MATPSTTYTPDTTPSGAAGTAILKTADGFEILTADGFNILLSDHGSGIYTADTTPSTTYTAD